MTLLRFTQKSLNILLSNSHLLTRLGKYQKPILQQLIIKSLTNPQVNLSHQVLQNICGSTKTSNQPGFNDQRSEERRVGKECKSRGAQKPETKSRKKDERSE